MEMTFMVLWFAFCFWMTWRLSDRIEAMLKRKPKPNPRTGSAAVAKERLRWVVRQDRGTVPCWQLVKRWSPTWEVADMAWDAIFRLPVEDPYRRRLEKSIKPRWRLERRI